MRFIFVLRSCSLDLVFLSLQFHLKLPCLIYFYLPIKADFIFARQTARPWKIDWNSFCLPFLYAYSCHVAKKIEYHFSCRRVKSVHIRSGVSTLAFGRVAKFASRYSPPLSASNAVSSSVDRCSRLL